MVATEDVWTNHQTSTRKQPAEGATRHDSKLHVVVGAGAVGTAVARDRALIPRV